MITVMQVTKHTTIVRAQLARAINNLNLMHKDVFAEVANAKKPSANAVQTVFTVRAQIDQYESQHKLLRKDDHIKDVVLTLEECTELNNLADDFDIYDYRLRSDVLVPATTIPEGYSLTLSNMLVNMYPPLPTMASNKPGRGEAKLFDTKLIVDQMGAIDFKTAANNVLKELRALPSGVNLYVPVYAVSSTKHPDGFTEVTLGYYLS